MGISTKCIGMAYGSFLWDGPAIKGQTLNPKPMDIGFFHFMVYPKSPLVST